MVAGGGLSGLAAVTQLCRAGVDAKLVEARDRIGGRVLTVANEQPRGNAVCDLGPSWIWPGQPLVGNLLNQLNIPVYQQYANGNVLVQSPTGSVETIPDPSPMAGALRIHGGIGNLIDAISNQIESSRLLLSHAAKSVRLEDDRVLVTCKTPSGETVISANKLAIAIPPRLAAELNYQPALADAAMQTLQATPTWMAGHAKFFAQYDRPFWREMGLCGSAFSRSGPLAEIHDASPDTEEAFCLFGFVGLDAEVRASLGEHEIIERVIKQLAAIFGPPAANPLATHYQDWSQEPFTAAAADRVPQTRHPQYGLNLELGPQWNDRLFFISSETSFANGGLIEGALEAAHVFVKRISPNQTETETKGSAHAASMGWDWI